jgi:hypothetical protein
VDARLPVTCTVQHSTHTYTQTHLSPADELHAFLGNGSLVDALALCLQGVIIRHEHHAHTVCVCVCLLVCSLVGVCECVCVCVCVCEGVHKDLVLTGGNEEMQPAMQHQLPYQEQEALLWLAGKSHSVNLWKVLKGI